MAPTNKLKLLVLGMVLSVAACSGEAEPRLEGAQAGLGSSSEEGRRTRPESLGGRERLAPGASLGTTEAPRKVVFDESPRPVGQDAVRLFVLGFAEGVLDEEEVPSHTRPSFFWASSLFPGGDWPISTSISLPSGVELIAVRDVDGDGLPGLVDRRSAIPLLLKGEGPEEVQFLLSRGFAPKRVDESEPEQEWSYDGLDLDAEASGLGATRFVRVAPAGAVLSEVRLKVLPSEAFTSDESSSVMVLGYPEASLDGDVPAKRVVPSFIWGLPEPSLALPQVYDAVVPEGLVLFVVVDLDGDRKMSEADYRSARFVAGDIEDGMLSVQIVLSLAESFGPFVVKGELIRAKAGAFPTAVKLRVSASADYGTRWEGAVFVLGYPEGSGGAESRAVQPSFVWRQKTISAEFPLPLSVPLSRGLEYVLVLDVTGDQVPSVGDAATKTWTPSAEGSVSAIEVVQPYQGTIQAMEDEQPGGAGKEQPGGAGKEPPRVHVSGGGKRVARRLSVPLGGSVPADWSSSLMIVGFPEGSVRDGQPSRGGRHQFFWESPGTIDRWPTQQQVDLPEELLYFAVLDVDGNRRPSPGDWSSSAFGVGQGEALEVVIAGAFGPDDRGEDDGPAIDDDDDDDDDDSSDGEDFEDEDEDEAEDGEVAVGSVRPVGIDRSVLRRVVVDAQPRVPFLRRARILVAGFSPDSVEGGMPAPMSAPTYFWASEQLQIDWPVRAELRLPDVSGHTVYVILDLDDNGQPSPGDLSSVALVNYEAPSAGQDSEFLLNKAYSVSVRLAPTASP